MSDLVIDIENEQLKLIHERAIYWESKRTLFIADPHFGKTATFRAHGIPLPEGNTLTDLQRLTQSLQRTQASTLIILGDLIHAAKGRDEQTLAALSQWCKQHTDVEILLVRGNHDKHAGDPPAEWGITCIDAPIYSPPFLLTHTPLEAATHYVLAGHVHPAVQLVGKGRQTLKLPCFQFKPRYGVLPAFGSFIDHTVIKLEPTDRVYPLTSTQVFAL